MVYITILEDFLLPHLEKLQKPKNVHFKGEGSLFLGKKVTAQILKLLK